ncbi:MAG TPA: tripartite tricarboxylate transporter TctB family protein [Gemmatimonadaceae bacterium]|nr:tripartite tricarboxylate transporter TctB family protein [Gemmatimonadaceae bacterium]
MIPQGHALRALLAVMGGVAAFALLVERAGFVPATFAATLLAGLAPSDVVPVRAVVHAAVVTVVIAVLFLVILAQPMRAFGGP